MERQADWRQEKAQALARARVVVIKVGSAVLTDAQGLSAPVLESLARQMSALRTAPDGHERRLALVSSGAVAAGSRRLPCIQACRARYDQMLGTGVRQTRDSHQRGLSGDHHDSYSGKNDANRSWLWNNASAHYWQRLRQGRRELSRYKLTLIIALTSSGRAEANPLWVRP